MTRVLSQVFREEAFVLEGGLGLVRFCGEEGESALFCRGQPVALSWSDNRGSIASFLALTGSLNLEAELESLRWLVAGYVEPRAPLGEQLAPLLRVFPRGQLRLRHREADERWSLVEVDQVPALEHFYPLDTIVMTQPRPRLDERRIEDFCAAIQRGDRPIALCARTRASDIPHVLDGHHKLLAYSRLRIQPHLIEVEVEPEPLEPGMQDAFLTDGKSRAAYEDARRRLEEVSRRRRS